MGKLTKEELHVPGWTLDRRFNTLTLVQASSASSSATTSKQPPACPFCTRSLFDVDPLSGVSRCASCRPRFGCHASRPSCGLGGDVVDDPIAGAVEYIFAGEREDTRSEDGNNVTSPGGYSRKMRPT